MIYWSKIYLHFRSEKVNSFILVTQSEERGNRDKRRKEIVEQNEEKEREEEEEELEKEAEWEEEER